MTIPTTHSTLHTPDFGLNSDPAPREPWCPVTHHATQFIHDKIPESTYQRNSVSRVFTPKPHTPKPHTEWDHPISQPLRG